MARTYFQDAWLEIPDYSTWLRKGPISSQFICLLCNPRKSLGLSNMGIEALKKHANGTKHKANANAAKAQPSVALLVANPAQPAANGPPPIAVPQAAAVGPFPAGAPPAVPHGPPPVLAVPQAAAVGPFPVNLPRAGASNAAGVCSPFVVGTAVRRAEIIWSLHVINQHFSFNSQQNFAEVQRAMYPDSRIAAELSLGPDKCAYVVAFGLAPHFQSVLLGAVKAAGPFAVCFDEAHNSVVQRGQMDTHVRFWDSSLNQVSTRFLGSAFLGHATAVDLMVAFRQALNDLDLSNLLQVSMDGPAVNWCFFKSLKKELQKYPNDPAIVEIGSCGLHVIHGSFRTGHDKAGWTVNGFLCCLYTLLKDSPARRSDFAAVECDDGGVLFPLKFCSHRWLENIPVAERAIALLPRLREYVMEGKQYDTHSFKTLKTSLSDVFLHSKLEFFKSVSCDVRGFLTKFQAAKPMAPLLYNAVDDLLRTLMARFVKGDIMNAAHTHSKLFEIDITPGSESCKDYLKTDVGIGASAQLKKVPKSTPSRDLKMLNFFKECQVFLSAMCAKIIERSPLQFPVVRAISCFDPSLLQLSDSGRSIAVDRFKAFVQHLVSCNRITTTSADLSAKQFRSLINTPECKLRMSTFSDEDRLDDLFYELMGAGDKLKSYGDAWEVTKLALLLSHGNASVEAGFSVNEALIVPNMLEESVVAQRTVYDAVRYAGGVLKVDISDGLLKSVKLARARWADELERRRKAKHGADAAASAERQKVKDKIEELLAKKRKIQEDSTAEIDEQVRKLQKKTVAPIISSVCDPQSIEKY